jgi:hypothetical protein
MNPTQSHEWQWLGDHMGLVVLTYCPEADASPQNGPWFCQSTDDEMPGLIGATSFLSPMAAIRACYLRHHGPDDET